MFCINCGRQLPDGTVFCGACGSRQDEAPSPIPQPVNIQYTNANTIPAYNQSMYSNVQSNYNQQSFANNQQSYNQVTPFVGKKPVFTNLAFLLIVLGIQLLSFILMYNVDFMKAERERSRRSAYYDYDDYDYKDNDSESISIADLVDEMDNNHNDTSEAIASIISTVFVITIIISLVAAGLIAGGHFSKKKGMLATGTLFTLTQLNMNIVLAVFGFLIAKIQDANTSSYSVSATGFFIFLFIISIAAYVISFIQNVIISARKN